MADSDESEIDDDEFIKIFEDSDDKNEFKGFGPEDLIPNYEILREIDLQQSLKDRNVQPYNKFGWLRDDSPPLCAPFTATPGLNMQLTGDPKPIFFFNLLFKDDMWSLIMTQTNLYVQKCIENGQLKDKLRLQKWRPVIVDEMKVFLSLVIGMGLTHKGDIDAYWATDEVIATPFFGKMMAKDRFYAILSNLHLVESDHAPEDQRLTCHFTCHFTCSFLNKTLNLILVRFSELKPNIWYQQLLTMKKIMKKVLKVIKTKQIFR